MWKPDLCIYHGNCDDGFAAALVARNKWPDLPCFGALHNKPLPADVAGKNVLMVDFSLKRDVMVQQLWKSCIVLDHHKTAEADLAPFVSSHIDVGPSHIGNLEGIHAMFDMDHSGATLTAHWVFPEGRGEKLPRFLLLIRKRDLWQLDHEVECFSAALRSYPQDFKLWQIFMDSDEALKQLIADGEPILRAHARNIDKICDEAHELLFDRPRPELLVRVPAVNAPYHYASDAAHALLQRYREAPFAAAYFRRKDGRWQFSLRSTPNRMDVSEVALRFGGGGHRNSAGFDVGELEELREAK